MTFGAVEGQIGMNTVTADIPSRAGAGFAAGPNQSEELPFGEGVDERLHTCDVRAAEENRRRSTRSLEAGAYIMGRNMFGPGRGEWDLDWTGWWGPEPPYHAPVFVLTTTTASWRWTAARPGLERGDPASFTPATMTTAAR